MNPDQIDLGDGMHARVQELEQRIDRALAICNAVPPAIGSLRSDLALQVRLALEGVDTR